MQGQGVLLLIAAIALGYGGGQLALTLVGQRAAHPRRCRSVRRSPQVENAASDPVPEGWPAVFDPYVPDPPKAQTPPKKVENYRLIGLVADGAEAGRSCRPRTGT